MDDIKIAGVPVEMGGVRRVIPPLNLKALKLFQERIANFKGGLDPESIQLVLDVAYSALKRNYPEITMDEIEDAIDVSNMGDIFSAIMDVSGLQRKASEAEAAAGKLGETSP